MLVIFEGPDGAGKTTTAAMVAEALGLKVSHPGRPPESFDEIKQLVAEQFKLAQSEQLHILDRSTIISEIVYRQFRLGEYGEDVLEFLTKALASLKDTTTLVIYMKTDKALMLRDGQIFSEYDTEDTKRVVNEQSQTILDLYDTTMQSLAKWMTPVIQFDYSRDQVDNLTEIISTVFKV